MPIHDGIQDLPLEEVVGDRFGRYSKYIIQERALPDIRDGLKPVQRRILYAMYAEGNTSEKGFRKSAKTVGNVIGNYHPHGDSSVYEAMVRMSQDWKNRMPLIEMHGNNGSLDGDSAAAMRYTEARLGSLSAHLLQDLEKGTVEMIDNFDETTKEPTVLPAHFPNLLVNGATGIAAGYATDIPPHNLGEVIEAVIYRLKHANCSIDDIMTIIPGPDFPTGGIIQGVKGIKDAYTTGKGKIFIRSQTEIETIRSGRQQIIVTEIPYEVNKANMVKRIDELRLDKKVEGISEVRDESDRTGLRIAIELKKDVNVTGILNYLYKNTDLQVSYNFNMVAIDDKRPRLNGILGFIDAYIKHQQEIITRRSIYDVKKARDRQHIIEGLMKALSILDEVIAMIRSSKDKKNAKENLVAAFAFSVEQAEAIVTLQLYRLTNTDITELQAEGKELSDKIAQLEAILGDVKVLNQTLVNGLKAINKKFPNPRRSVIEEKIEELKIDRTVLVASEEVMVSVTAHGYIKRTGLRSFSASTGVSDLAMKENDHVVFAQQMNTMDFVVVFTDKGNYVYRPVHELTDIRWKDLGEHVSHLANADSSERIVAVLPLKDFSTELAVVFTTANGMIKRSTLDQYQPQRYARSLTGVKLKGADSVVTVFVANDSDKVSLTTNKGYNLTFALNEVPLANVRTSGVKGINLKPDDFVIGAVKLAAGHDLLLVTQRGSVKRFNEKHLELQSRALRGLLMLRELKAKPHRYIAMLSVAKEDSVTILTANDTTVDVEVQTVNSVTDRYSNGSFVLDEIEDGQAIAAWLNPAPKLSK
ncbi:DNA topoisomerase IV subunit A [Brochothrix campestris]|uniref:DNA topoisomerase 4 subunit A n=1 Tax=Brochothrix campestris FSL F6-1037 TaxID=1265861 RepID=W7DA96_9LIST|nr:DNA topoisomerase IV subunit A [Brochothrix campestris]EUJ42188.1 DNA topoisomerase IV subunit A [Brochothrix campestris FSL F6-1037]